MKWTERALFLVENVDLETATGVGGARWEHFQLAHLCDESTFRIENKSRQIAWSWLSAAEGIANAILDATPSVYISINQREAAEKIRYARQVLEALPKAWRPPLKRDNELELELANGARLTSLPSQPPRGRARAWVYLDEWAHHKRDRAIYTAALPVISKGGRLRGGSSPLGASGVFWEVFEEKLRRYPGYTRKKTPWWEVQAFSVNVSEARRLAPGMPTAERVKVFGNERIQAIYANMPEEDFRQEYECEIVDEATAWITWAEIRANQDEDLVCELTTVRGDQVDLAMRAIDRVAARIAAGHIERGLCAGLDIGRTRNASELFVGGLTTVDTFPLRLALTMEGMSFDEQRDVLSYALERLPITKLLADQTGIGRNLAETLEQRFGDKAEGVTFDVTLKTVWASDAKMLIQQRRTLLPVDRDIAYQLHSIKRRVTAARNLVFDTDEEEKHHADKFWAWALMLAAGKQPAQRARTRRTA